MGCAGRLRPLNRPRPLSVETGEDVRPIALHLSGHCCSVEAVLETWRIDDEWWRERTVSLACNECYLTIQHSQGIRLELLIHQIPSEGDVDRRGLQ